MRLASKTAIVTGSAANSGGAGIGQAIAELFGREGARVVVADISPDGRLTAERIGAAGGEAIAVQADLTERRDVERLVATVVARFGRIDILVNVAGGALEEEEFLAVDDDLWRRIVDLNLKTVHLCCQLVAP